MSRDRFRICPREGSEAVRSLIRPSGSDLNGDSNLRNAALAVGTLFKQPQGNWALSTLFLGLADDDGQLGGLMQSLTYPAGQAWDRTSEQQGQVQERNFGEAGFSDKGREVDLIKQGQLPCMHRWKSQPRDADRKKSPRSSLARSG